MLLVLVVLAAFGLAAFTYLGLERLGRRGWVPLVCRAHRLVRARAAAGQRELPGLRRPSRPLVAARCARSAWTPAGGRWREARDSAARLGRGPAVRRRADQGGLDSDAGTFALAPALLAASASDRPLIVVSDGEIEDVREIPPDLLARSRIRLFPQDSRARPRDHPGNRSSPGQRR